MTLLALILGACSPVATAAPDATPEQGAPAGEYHPLTIRTGQEQFDNLLAALASGEAEQLRALIEFTRAPCTWTNGLGGPPKCKESESEGTRVEVLPSIGSEGSFLRREDVAAWPGVQAAGVYAIYKVSPAVTFEQYYPAGEYVLIVVDKDGQSPILLRMSGGRIVRVDYPPERGLEAMKGILERESSELVLPPLP